MKKKSAKGKQERRTKSLGLDLFQMDALQEIGNIAGAHVATTLSGIIGEMILVDFSESNAIFVENLPTSIGSPTDEVLAVYMKVCKDSKRKDNGMIFLVFPHEKALRISELFQKKPPESLKYLHEEDHAAIIEIGNICICSYLNALSKFLDSVFVPTPPAIASGMLGAILQLPASLAAEHSTYAIVINTKFIRGKDKVYGFLMFIPDLEMQKALLVRFGVDPEMKVRS